MDLEINIPYTLKYVANEPITGSALNIFASYIASIFQKVKEAKRDWKSNAPESQTPFSYNTNTRNIIGYDIIFPLLGEMRGDVVYRNRFSFAELMDKIVAKPDFEFNSNLYTLYVDGVDKSTFVQEVIEELGEFFYWLLAYEKGLTESLSFETFYRSCQHFQNSQMPFLMGAPSVYNIEDDIENQGPDEFRIAIHRGWYANDVLMCWHNFLEVDEVIKPKLLQDYNTNRMNLMYFIAAEMEVNIKLLQAYEEVFAMSEFAGFPAKQLEAKKKGDAVIIYDFSCSDFVDAVQLRFSKLLEPIERLQFEKNMRSALSNASIDCNLGVPPDLINGPSL